MSAEEEHKIEKGPDFHDVTWESKYPFPQPYTNDDKLIDEENIPEKEKYSNLDIIMGWCPGWTPKTVMTTAGWPHKLWNTFKSGSTRK